MPLQKLQQQLQQIYAVDIPQSVTDYLITDPRLAAQLSGGAGGCERPERLLLRQQDDWLELSLYISREIIDHLTDRDPTALLDETNLSEFCVALEGVSHFVYLSWNAAYDRAVSLLELELQAEIDKYIAAVTLLDDQRGHGAHRHLHRRLFRAVSFAPGLNDEERRRYWLANHYAERYCEHLQERFLLTRQPERMMRELRRFYRLPRQDKMQRIATVR